MTKTFPLIEKLRVRSKRMISHTATRIAATIQGVRLFEAKMQLTLQLHEASLL